MISESISKNVKKIGQFDEHYTKMKIGKEELL